MSDFALMLGICYVGLLAYLGVTGGTCALKAHLFSLWVLLIVAAVLAEIIDKFQFF